MERTARGVIEPAVTTRTSRGDTAYDATIGVDRVLRRYAEAVEADCATVLKVDPGAETEMRALRIAVLAVRRGGALEFRRWRDSPPVLHPANGSFLDRVLATDHGVTNYSLMGVSAHVPDAAELTLAAPIRPAGVCMGVLFARFASESAGHRRWLISTTEVFAERMARALVERPGL